MSSAAQAEPDATAPGRAAAGARAGGVVWREAVVADEHGHSRTGVEIVLVHRPRYDDWSFPKGKLDKGETFEQAACARSPRRPASCAIWGPSAALDDLPRRQGRSKLVRYWSMRGRSSPGRPTTRSTTAAGSPSTMPGAGSPARPAAARAPPRPARLTPAGRDLLVRAHHRASWHNVAAAFTSGSPAPSPAVHLPSLPSSPELGRGAPRQQPRGGHQVRATEQRRPAWLSIIVAVGLAVRLRRRRRRRCGGRRRHRGRRRRGRGTINISGSSTVEPISSLAAEAFMGENSGAEIAVDGPGTGDGFELFCRATPRSPTPPGPSTRRRPRPARRLASSTSSCRSPTTAWPS